MIASEGVARCVGLPRCFSPCTGDCRAVAGRARTQPTGSPPDQRQRRIARPVSLGDPRDGVVHLAVV